MITARPRLAIANRAEIAIRIARTARDRGWEPVVLLGEPDWHGRAAREAGTVVRLASGAEFDVDAVVRAAVDAGASALHPGYGFLSERPALSEACADAGIVFIGPGPKTLELAGDKIATREIADSLGVPVLTGSEALDLDDRNGWQSTAEAIGFPVIAKVAGAGGGRGLRVARTPDDLEDAIQSALNEAGGSGASAEIFLEHYLEGARHVEIQVAGDGQRVVVLGDRDCSLQRRHQKVVEEAPASALDADLREALHDAARRLAEGIGLLNLATVEFLADGDGRYFFMEINPRLQVEHTVTEEVSGLDLVAVQFSLAAGGDLPEPVAPSGHAIQARLYAEDPFRQFLPSPGVIAALDFPPAASLRGARLRVDAGYAPGDTVPGSYDPMIAKIIVHAPTRNEAIDGLTAALAGIDVAGIATNRPWLLAAMGADSKFRDNVHDLTTASTIRLESGPPPANILAGLASRSSSSISVTTAWESAGPFRTVTPATATFHGAEGDWQRTVSLAGRSDARMVCIPAGRGWEVVNQEGRWTVLPGPAISSGGVGAATDGDVRAPMPGTVLNVPVEAGHLVEKGQVVAVMEAMKIEMSLEAPFDGEVASVGVQAGDLVGIRQVLVTIQKEQAE